MSPIYHDGSRVLQDRFDTRRLAERLEERIVRDYLNENDVAFVERMDMFFLATADADGNASCSYKGGEPGFVRVIDNRTIAFPSYDGNGMYFSGGNMLTNPNVGLLFIDFANPARMRFNGVATVDFDDPLLLEYPEAQFIVRVRARQVFPNCPRYVHKMQLVERSRFVPRANCQTPIADWKTSEWASDVLPDHDPARFVRPDDQE